MRTAKTFLFFIAISWINAGAQDNYRAIHWMPADGLSQENVNWMLKDKYGFLWLATSFGVSRFDGSTFKNFFAGFDQKKSIVNNDTKDLVEDSLHNIWIGTTGGMSRYDIKADTFTQFPSDFKLHHVAIFPFAATRDYVYCMEPGALTTYDVHTLTRKIIMKLTSADDVSDGMGAFSTFLHLATNSVWMLDGKVNKSGGGLYEISLSNGARKRYPIPYYSNIASRFSPEGMRYDSKRNCIWINCSDGLVQFTISDRQFHHISAFDPITSLRDYRGYVGIDIDCTGRVWVATSPKGILIYDPSKQVLTIPFPHDSTLQKQVSEFNLSVYCDRDEITWSGFWLSKGLYQIEPISQAVQLYKASLKPDSLTNNVVFNCLATPWGQMWFGTPDGFDIYDPVRGRFEVVREKDLHLKKGGLVLCFAVSASGKKVWLDISDCLQEMDVATRTCRRIVFQDYSGNQLSGLTYEYAIPYKGGCVVQAAHNHDLLIFRLEEGSVLARQILSISLHDVDGQVVADEDHIFFHHKQDNTTRTYSEKDGKWVMVANSLDSVARQKIFYDPADKTYWLTNYKQLLHYDKNFHFITSYQLSEDLPDHDIISVMPDSDHNIWFDTDINIFRLEPNSGKINAMGEQDGFLKQKFASCVTPVAKDIYGDIYFPTGVADGGIDLVRPSKFKEVYSLVYWRGLEINGDSLPLKTGLNDLEKIKLNHSQNNIDLEAGMINYYADGAVRLRYRLKEISGQWHYNPRGYNAIRYDALSPGAYTLEVQASNAAGDFYGPIKTLLIQITPPFWKTWWFLSMIAIAVAAGVNGLNQFRLKQRMRVMNVRQKLHRDLHDDVGATLSSVKAYSEILQTSGGNGLISGLIKKNAEEMIDRLEVIAWATNPQHDSFKSFRELMSRSASPLCHAKNIDFSIHSNGLSETMVMPGDVRQNLFLVFKEAINNTLKYSEASCCVIDISIHDRHFYFAVSDNGRGSNGTILGSGNGWKNMKKRTEELSGTIKIESAPGKGTTIMIDLPFPFKIPSFWGNGKTAH